jgi:hypothetical protein
MKRMNKKAVFVHVSGNDNVTGSDEWNLSIWQTAIISTICVISVL